MPELLQDTISINVDGVDYLFAIPSYYDEIKIGMVEREIRRSVEQELLGPNQVATGMPTGDNTTDFLVRTAANFKVLLRKCSSQWPYSAGANGLPEIDFTKWPRDKVSTAFAVGVRLNEEVNRFRSRGAGDRISDGEQIVAGQSNPTVEPVRPDAASSQRGAA